MDVSKQIRDGEMSEGRETAPVRRIFLWLIFFLVCM